VAIFGAGPVGLLCASCARLNGAEQIFIIDHNDYRLDFAQQRYGAIPINFDTMTTRRSGLSITRRDIAASTR
jgi:threonine dehydrogenase-like Zn-dependent dehydrogenase